MSKPDANPAFTAFYTNAEQAINANLAISQASPAEKLLFLGSLLPIDDALNQDDQGNPYVDPAVWQFYKGLTVFALIKQKSPLANPLDTTVPTLSSDVFSAWEALTLDEHNIPNATTAAARIRQEINKQYGMDIQDTVGAILNPGLSKRQESFYIGVKSFEKSKLKNLGFFADGLYDMNQDLQLFQTFGTDLHSNSNLWEIYTVGLQLQTTDRDIQALLRNGIRTISSIDQSYLRALAKQTTWQKIHFDADHANNAKKTEAFLANMTLLQIGLTSKDWDQFKKDHYKRLLPEIFTIYYAYQTISFQIDIIKKLLPLLNEFHGIPVAGSLEDDLMQVIEHEEQTNLALQDPQEREWLFYRKYLFALQAYLAHLGEFIPTIDKSYNDLEKGLMQVLKKGMMPKILKMSPAYQNKGVQDEDAILELIGKEYLAIFGEEKEEQIYNSTLAFITNLDAKTFDENVLFFIETCIKFVNFEKYNKTALQEALLEKVYQRVLTSPIISLELITAIKEMLAKSTLSPKLLAVVTSLMIPPDFFPSIPLEQITGSERFALSQEQTGTFLIGIEYLLLHKKIPATKEYHAIMLLLASAHKVLAATATNAKEQFIAMLTKATETIEDEPVLKEILTRLFDAYKSTITRNEPDIKAGIQARLPVELFLLLGNSSQHDPTDRFWEVIRAVA